MSEAKAAARRDHCQAILVSPVPGVPFIAIRTVQGELRSIEFLRQAIPVTQPLESVTTQALAHLNNYFSGHTQTLQRIRPASGTPFQHRVWQLLLQIPAGQTRRYGEIAEQLGTSAQAVAGACRANPLPILIPCHRVIAADGLGGYMGQIEGEAVEIKRWLLHHEAHV